MEKLKPHYALAAIKELCKAGQISSTKTALTNAAAMGFSFEEMIEVVMELNSADFYKSMTTHADHTIWQDVYHANTHAGEVYLKLTVTEDVLIVSFKEL